MECITASDLNCLTLGIPFRNPSHLDHCYLTLQLLVLSILLLQGSNSAQSYPYNLHLFFSNLTFGLQALRALVSFSAFFFREAIGLFVQGFLDPFFQLLGVVRLPFQFPHEENVQEHRCRKNYDELELKFMFHFLLLSLGAKAKEHCMGKAHVQPELASGINSIPPAGMALIQQPGRLTLVILLNFPVEGR